MLTNILLLGNIYIHKSIKSTWNWKQHVVQFMMSLYLIANKSPQCDEKLNCNQSFVLYRRILFTGNTIAPSSSSCSLPDLYILMPKCMHIVSEWLMFNHTKKVLPELPAALYLALSLAVGHHWRIFQSELIHTVGLWIADSSRYLACQICPRRRIGDNLRSLLWYFTLRDCHLRERAPICLRCRACVCDLSKPVGEWKIGLKSCSVNLA